MGKVYSFADIEHGRVPRRESFHAAKEFLKEGLGYLVDSKLVSGAKIFGSVAHGTPSERSDCDVLILTENDKALEQLRDIVHMIYEETSVCVEPVVISRDLAEVGVHTIDASFFRHIAGIEPHTNVVGVDPTTIMEPTNEPITRVHQQYLAQKLRKLKEGLFSTAQDERRKAFQRSLEAPMNAGRRTLEAISELGKQKNRLDDSKSAVTAAFRETYRHGSIRTTFDELLTQDYDYTALLREAMTGSISKDFYEPYVENMIEECVPAAINWIHDLSIEYTSLLEGAHLQPEGMGRKFVTKEH